MKKRGYSLVMVLIITSALLILGVAVSAAIISATKFNAKYSENIDLDLAAKSGLNVTVDKLVSTIKSTTDSALLPEASEYKEVIFENSNAFEGILVETAIDKNLVLNELGDEITEYTVKSKAINRNNTNIYKESKQKILINNNGDVTEGEVEFTLTKVLNVTNRVDLVWSDVKAIDNISYGGSINRNNINIQQNPNNDLNKLSLSINNTNLNKFSDYLDIGNIEKFNKNISGVEIAGKDVAAKTLNNINNSNIIIKGDIFINSNEKIVDITLTNSTVIIYGNLNSNLPVNINLNNSSLIIKGETVVNNNLNVKLLNNSLIEVDSKINADITNIEVDNSKYVIYGDMIIDTNITFNIKNDSIVKICGKFEVQSTINVSLNSSKMDIDGDFISHTSFDLNLDNNSLIDVNGKLEAPGKIKATLNDTSYFIVKGEMTSSSTGFDLSINNKSIAIVQLLKAPNLINIKLENSVFITGSIYSEYSVVMNMMDSNLIIRGTVFSNSGFNASLNNSSIISLGDVRVPYSATITNINKSYILTVGNFYTEGISINGGDKSIIPDSKTVEKSINYFLSR